MTAPTAPEVLPAALLVTASLAAAPLPVTGAVGAPVNPIAVK